VEAALKRLSLPVHAIPGDHDKATGTLHLFQRYLAPALYRAVDVLGFRLLFLNAMDGISPQSFDFSEEQMSWLERQLNGARVTGLRPLVFTHLYPSELETQGGRFSRAVCQAGVELVEMGHTHYNELANDGRTIYATTRSTGQAEEGPPGFSITVIDDDVIGWKFKERERWPLAMITSPADEKLITRPASPHHVVRGEISVCARVWDAQPIRSVVMLAGQGCERRMQLIDGIWTCKWNSADVDDGVHRLSIRAETVDTRTAEDTISILISQSGKYRESARHSTDYENAIGPYPEKCIVGTQLGPNENGTKGPWPSWREPKTVP